MAGHSRIRLGRAITGMFLLRAQNGVLWLAACILMSSNMAPPIEGGSKEKDITEVSQGELLELSVLRLGRFYFDSDQMRFSQATYRPYPSWCLQASVEAAAVSMSRARNRSARAVSTQYT